MPCGTYVEVYRSPIIIQYYYQYPGEPLGHTSRYYITPQYLLPVDYRYVYTGKNAHEYGTYIQTLFLSWSGLFLVQNKYCSHHVIW